MNFHFVFLSILFFLSISSASHVHDTNGYYVVPGAGYYLLSSNRTAGGGLAVSSYGTDDQNCPETVTQEPSNNNGLPCIFFPSNPSETSVHLKTSLNIAFTGTGAGAGTCVNTTTMVWQVGGLDAYAGSPIVKIGGKVGKPGCATAANWFRISKGSHKGSYRLVYNAHDVCRSVRGKYTISVHEELGKSVLVVAGGGEPLEFVFVKARKAAAIEAY